jgi:hypothetical protein
MNTAKYVFFLGIPAKLWKSSMKYRKEIFATPKQRN